MINHDLEFSKYLLANGNEMPVIIKDETMWMTQNQIAVLYGTDRTNVGKHLTKIYKERELVEKSTIRNFALPYKLGHKEDGGS